MTMQNNIDIIGQNVGLNMLQPKLQSIAGKIDNERPIRVPIAIAADDRQWRTDRTQIVGDRRLAHVAQMPDLIPVARKIDNLLRQFVMRVREHEDAKSFAHSEPRIARIRLI
jgi:hypothetical protein